MKKIIYVMFSFIMILSLVSCGKAVPAMNGDDLEKDADEVAGISGDSASINEESEDTESEIVIEGMTEIIGTEVDEEDEIMDEAMESITSSENTVPAPTPVVEEESEPEPHVHQYIESITVQPTCVAAGEKTSTCECGDVRTESVPATGSHNWVEQTTLVHHDELGHVVQETVLVGWTEPHTEYECAYCGHRENTPEDLRQHFIATGDFDHVFARTFAYDYPAEPIYETQSKWVVDTPAWDESVVVGYTCSVCGATQ